MEDMLIGVVDRTVLVFIPDPASTTGAGKTGLAAAAVTVTYTRVETDNDVVHTDVTSSVNDLSALTDAHNDWGWKEVSATLSKGLYRLDIADAVFAAGAWYGIVQVTITSGTAAATPKAFRLINRNDLTDTAQTGDNFARLGAPAGASVSADVAAVKSQTAAIETDTQDIQTRLPAALTADGNIKADTLRVGGTLQTAGDIPARLPAALTADGNIKADTLRVGGTLQTAGDIPARLPAALTAGGNMKSDTLALSGSTAGADALEESTEAIAYGTADGTGATTTVFLSSALTPDSAVNDQFNGRVLIFKSDTTTAALRGQATTISDYAHTSAEVGTFTVVALTTAPSSGDTFVIL